MISVKYWYKVFWWKLKCYQMLFQTLNPFKEVCSNFRYELRNYDMSLLEYHCECHIGVRRSRSNRKWKRAHFPQCHVPQWGRHELGIPQVPLCFRSHWLRERENGRRYLVFWTVSSCTQRWAWIRKVMKHDARSGHKFYKLFTLREPISDFKLLNYSRKLNVIWFFSFVNCVH